MTTKINLIDKTIVGCSSIVEAAARCGTSKPDQRHAKTVEYVRNKAEWDGITLFTDKCIHEVDSVKSKVKAGIILESWVLDPNAYRAAYAFKDKYDVIFTYNPQLLSEDPDKFVFCPSDTVCIDSDSMKMHEKSKLVSMTYSNKTFLPGHAQRHEVVDKVVPSVKTEVDLFGAGTGQRLEMKSDALRDYMFSIEIENAPLPNYFTEKLLDCFVTGTVPIYWGAPNIDEFFNPEGIIRFSSLSELQSILSDLSEEQYEKMLPAVKENFDLAMKDYAYIDDYVLSEINKRFILG